tara:strand:- start:30 stop:290 length:261 start_codon:yes stop_codon:yes gene_type:complete
LVGHRNEKVNQIDQPFRKVLADRKSDLTFRKNGSALKTNLLIFQKGGCTHFKTHWLDGKKKYHQPIRTIQKLLNRFHCMGIKEKAP